MPQQVPAGEVPPQETRAQLAALVKNFERDAQANGKRIRELIEQDREGFYVNAIDILRSSTDCRGAHYLITALLGQDLFVRALCDPRLTHDQAVALARTALDNHAMVDVELARFLASQSGEDKISREVPVDVGRMMAILSEISTGTRVLPALMALARQKEDKHVQSKAVLMIGKANRSAKWVQNRLNDGDARIRANAIEALWDVDSEDAREVLAQAAKDPNNRVAGNALLGLYRLGDTAAIPEILKFAENDSRLFRATAAWVMGQTGDPRFTKALARLLAEPSSPVRTRAFEALGQIRAATTQAGQGDEWRVVGRFHRSVAAGWRRLQVEVSSRDAAPVKLLPTQFILSEDGQAVLSYTVEQRRVPECLAVTFLYPRPAEATVPPFVEGALNALKWKRPSDLWSALPFLLKRREVHVKLAGEKIDFEVTEQAADDEGTQTIFTCDPEAARAALLKPVPKLQCADLWGSLRRLTLEKGPARGQRQVIVYAESDASAAAGYPETASAARNANISVHAISHVPNPSLENLCVMTHGSFQELPEGSTGVATAVQDVLLNLVAQYSIRYHAVNPEAASLGIRAQSSDGWGEVNIPIPATLRGK